MQVAMANQIIDQQYRRRISKESTLSDLPEEQAQLLANFRAVPDSEFVRLEVPAIVVMEPGPSETPPPLSELTELGTLNLMVTDVTQAFPRFSELTGGRSIGGVYPLGFANAQGVLRPVFAGHSYEPGKPVAQPPAAFAVGGIGTLSAAFAAHDASRKQYELPAFIVHEADGERAYVFAKNLEGDWLLPSPAAGAVSQPEDVGPGA